MTYVYLARSKYALGKRGLAEVQDFFMVVMGTGCWLHSSWGPMIFLYLDFQSHLAPAGQEGERGKKPVITPQPGSWPC